MSELTGGNCNRHRYPTCYSHARNVPPGSGAYVYGKDRFQWKARRCCNLAKQPIAHESAKEEWAAKKKWREIYGTSFPN